MALPWDTEVSRLHAELERIAGEWTIVDDGLSRNGTYVNGTRISGRTRLRDGDTRAHRAHGAGLPQPRRRGDPGAHRRSPASRVALADLPPTQRAVLVALARPYKHGEFATPATNQHIAGELHLSVDAVKAHLRSLFQRFGIEHAPAEPEALAAGGRGVPARHAHAARPLAAEAGDRPAAQVGDPGAPAVGEDRERVAPDAWIGAPSSSPVRASSRVTALSR